MCIRDRLDSDTETLYSTARKHLCQLSTLRWQQKDGLDTVLPYGLRKIQALRTLTTESTAVLIPFRAQEIMPVSYTHLSRGCSTPTRRCLSGESGYDMGKILVDH